MKLFTLYGTSACHLCELAMDLVQSQLSDYADSAVESVDISESDALFERYGLSIPVLRHPDARELFWPFDAQQVQQFMQS